MWWLKSCSNVSKISEQPNILLNPTSPTASMAVNILQAKDIFPVAGWYPRCKGFDEEFASKSLSLPICQNNMPKIHLFLLMWKGYCMQSYRSPTVPTCMSYCFSTVRYRQLSDDQGFHWKKKKQKAGGSRFITTRKYRVRNVKPQLWWLFLFTGRTGSCLQRGSLISVAYSHCIPSFSLSQTSVQSLLTLPKQISQWKVKLWSGEQ